MWKIANHDEESAIQTDPILTLSRKNKLESVKEISARQSDSPGIQQLLTDRHWLSGVGERVTVTIF